MDFSSILRELRGDTPIKEVAEKTGITERSLRAYEQGYRTPSDERKVILSNYFKKSVGFIFFNKEFTNSKRKEK